MQLKPSVKRDVETENENSRCRSSVIEKETRTIHTRVKKWVILKNPGNLESIKNYMIRRPAVSSQKKDRSLNDRPISLGCLG